MKFLVVFLALVALAVGYQIVEPRGAQPFSISSEIVQVIENTRDQMPCGFPSRGIPPLAPLRAKHREFTIKTEDIDLSGEVNDFRLDGLNDFDIVEFKVNAILSRINFKFQWKNIHANTLYKLLANKFTGLEMDLIRQGLAKLAIKDLIVWGQARYSLGVISGNLRLKEFKLYASIREVKSEIEGLSKYKIVNKKINEIIEEWIILAINDNTENLAEISNKFVVPLVNEKIGDMTLNDLLGLIGGGGGGGEGEAGAPGKEPCVPPQTYIDSYLDAYLA